MKMKMKPNKARKILQRYKRNKAKLEAGAYTRPCHLISQKKFITWVESNKQELEELASYQYKYPGKKPGKRYYK